MEIHHRLGELLHQYQQRNPALHGWRFDLHITDGLDIGLKNNKIGGPYSAPGYKQSISGEIYLIWENHRYTSAKLSARVVEDFNEYIGLWEKTAYYDPDGVDLYTPTALPEVKLSDDRVKQIIDQDNGAAFELLTHGLEALQNNGIHKVDGSIKCFQDHRFLMNSNGFQVNYDQTPVEFYFIANDSYGEGYSEKKWPDAREVERIIHNTIEVGKSLDVSFPTQFSGPMTLIFPPEIFESFLSQFLLTNLYGSLVVNRQSRFTLEDFKNRRQILRNDFSLTVNSLLPYRGFSTICTAEGVPASETRFVESGHLLTPILNLKYSKKAGMPPTSALAGGGGFFFTSSQELPTWEQLLAETERALIIYSVLGMHTQDATTGNFSLTADQCLLVENGQIRGKVKAVINGDFLAGLNREDSRLCRVEGEDNPGFAFTANAMSV